MESFLWTAAVYAVALLALRWMGMTPTPTRPVLALILLLLNSHIVQSVENTGSTGTADLSGEAVLRGAVLAAALLIMAPDIAAFVSRRVALRAAALAGFSAYAALALISSWYSEAPFLSFAKGTELAAAVLAVWIGVFPDFFLSKMQPAVNSVTDQAAAPLAYVGSQPGLQAFSVPGSAWDRSGKEAPPPVEQAEPAIQGVPRQSLETRMTILNGEAPLPTPLRILRGIRTRNKGSSLSPDPVRVWERGRNARFHAEIILNGVT